MAAAPCVRPLFTHSTHTRARTHHQSERCCSDGECRKIATASKDATVKIWDLGLGRCITVLSGHTMSVTCLRWGGDGLIYTGSQDRMVKVYAAEDVRACPSAIVLIG